MIPKNTSKLIISLHQKKYRQRNRLFLVEGAKSVTELLQSDMQVELLLGTAGFLQQNMQLIPPGCAVEQVGEAELARLGTFETNNAALALAHMRPDKAPEIEPGRLTVALDEVRDPGNLGTIIRIADWYGIRNLVCSSGCADFYNPKTIAASMGSFCRVTPYYTDLPAFLSAARTTTQVFAAALDGHNVNRLQLEPNGILVMGNEANGIRAEIMAMATQLVTIPRFGEAESLNVAIATAILCDHFYRSQ